MNTLPNRAMDLCLMTAKCIALLGTGSRNRKSRIIKRLRLSRLPMYVFYLIACSLHGVIACVHILLTVAESAIFLARLTKNS